jgi:hypothetical protein
VGWDRIDGVKIYVYIEKKFEYAFGILENCLNAGDI